LGTISNIRWPGGDGESKSAGPGEISFAIDDSGKIDSSTVIIDLSDPFPRGITKPSEIDPPSITLPNGKILPLTDKMGAVVISAIKHPSDFKLYATIDQLQDSSRDTSILIFPDTLIVTLSEKIVPLPGVVNPYKEMLLYYPTADAVVPVLLPSVSVVPLTEDSLTWQVLMPAEFDITSLNIDDALLLNPNAPLSDSAGNDPSEAPKETGGEDGDKSDIDLDFRVLISGHSDPKYNNNANFADGIEVL
ncbi:MAG: hypothetical protein GY869_20640, partial [Planctomycetes bacterium]|nr:hypothetical protein [Planctomycetota bacterium]